MKMCETNFDKFNKVTLYTLVKLFDAFPEPIFVDATRFTVEALGCDNGGDAPQLFLDEQRFGLNTLNWLELEGFILVNTKTLSGSFHDVRLTLKGLTLLGYSMPNKGEATFIEQAKDVLDGSIKQTATDLLSGIFTSAIAYGIKTMANS